MSFNFTVKEFILGNGTGTPTFQFYRRGFNLGSSGSSPEWKDIILSGNTALTLVNAKAGGLNYLKLFGGTEQLPETYIDSVTLDGKCEQNGTPTPTVPVDIVCNNGAIKYSANMANVNAQTVLIGYYISGSGVVTVDNNNWIYQNYISVKPNTTYTLTMSSSVYYVTISEYSTADDSGFVIRKAGSSGDNTTLTITTESTTNYIRFGTNIDRSAVTLDRVLAINWMLNQGNSMAYQPYVEGGIYTDGTIETVTDSNGLTANAEMLLSVGDYKDTQEVLSGSVTRNVGIKVMTGDETFISGANGWISEDAITDNLKDTYTPICTHFGGTDTTPTANSNTVRVYYTSQNLPRVYFGVDKSVYNTATVFQQYLADQYANGTPVIVVYPTSSATTEAVTPQLLQKEPVTVTGSLTGLVANVVSSSHTTPTPTQPLAINCNNGVLKYGQYGKNLFDKDSSLVNGYINSSGAVVSGGLKVSTFIEIKPNTTYTISGTGDVKALSFDRYAYTYTAEQTPIAQIPSQAGGASTTFTTAQNAKYIRMQMTVDAVNTCQLELGSTATEYEPYHYGIHTDGTIEMVGIKDVNNLLPVDAQPDVLYPVTVTSAGSWTASANVANGQNLAACEIRYYNANKQQINYYTMNGYSDGRMYKTFSVTTSAKYVSISRKQAYATTPVTELKVEIGGTMTPYFNGGSATAEMLLKVGNYQDIQSVLDGNVTRKVGVKVLDGTENYVKRSDYAINYSGLTDRVYSVSDYGICSHFVCSANNASTAPIGSLFFNVSNNYLHFFTEYGGDVASFKAWLTAQYNAGTPVTIVYALATPTTESVTGQPLTIQAGTNIVEITQASISNLPLEVSYKGTV